MPALDKMVQAKRRADAEAAAAATASAAKAARAAQAAPSDTVERLNKVHAVLPIGGKTRVVTFGEMEEFPGRETIVMTQTIDDFKSLQNKYRHSYQDEEGELQSIPLGSYWIRSPERRQYDGGMAFMPQHDGDVGNKLNLWRGFGVKAIKPDGKSAAAGCQKFLDFMRVIICSGNDAHFDYLLKREATIFQKRIRSEIALGLRTKEEGCGKGFYEATMGRLLGTHAMQVSNPKHIIGAFNPHLETLLRLTADEALFVGNHEHRNALFGLITEPTLTIEPKGCGLYKAASYLNLSVTSNADHFLPVSGTARRFFIPTVSAARMQDHKYFDGLKAELEDGGYEALLYHLLYEVDLAGFNVRAVPQTEELRQQRDHSLPPLEAWWCELLETGTLWGADPGSRIGRSATAISARSRSRPSPAMATLPPRPDTSTSLASMIRRGGSNRASGPPVIIASDGISARWAAPMEWVLRRRGWMFPPLSECRAEWVKRYPDWTWRSSGPAEWPAEETDDVMEMEDDDPPF